ncbi:MAG: hypothetical protein O6922_00965, partial [Chloroflexi bacterium]|nr:hypothetical protein [Chloroflexota bacterium]
MSQSQERKSDRSPASPVTRGSPGNPGSPDDQNSIPPTPPAQPDQRTSLTLSQLTALGALNDSTPVFQQNAARTLRTELSADAVLIIDYTDAFGTRVVRAVSGADPAVVGSEIWLPNWLTPIDVDAPAVLIDTEPARLSAVTAFVSGTEFRSALAVAVPGTTGAQGMVIALMERAVEIDDSQVETAKTIASLISMSASRAGALATVRRDEEQILAAHSISRAASDGPADHPVMLEKIAGLLTRFFEFDVIAHRARVDGEFVTLGLVADDQGQSYARTDPDFKSFESVESRAAALRTAVSNATLDTESSPQLPGYLTREPREIISTLAIPVNATATQILVLGSTRTNAFDNDAVATAKRFVPALAAAFASDSPDRFLVDGSSRAWSDIPGYLESIASATELMSACGVVATQVKSRTGASRVQVGFFDEETGRSILEFDTDPSEDILDFSWINSDEFEHLTTVASGDGGDTADPIVRYDRVRVSLKVVDRLIGFVVATQDNAGFNDADVTGIRRISAACAPVLANLRQLEQSRAALEKLEMLNRVCDQIRLDDSGDPLRSPRVASLIRNLFDADWLYFGRIDHENDYSTTEITDGLDVPELATGVRVSRRSLLIPSTAEVTSSKTVELDSVAPGQRASGRWMFRAGLRSAVCAPLRLNGTVAAMFICASRKPAAFGSMEKKLAARIVTELESSIEKASTVVVARDGNTGTAQIVLERLGPNLQAILNNISVVV